jgi:deoxyribodipyrimidine photo-lyase
MKINIFWFRRDLRLEDNTALWHALDSGLPVLPVFIFDTNILDELKPEDARIGFIYQKLTEIDLQLKKYGSSLKIFKSKPEEAFKSILNDFEVHSVFMNSDYEPYALERDLAIGNFLKSKDVVLKEFKDQVIFEKSEIVKPNGEAYTIFTPYKNKWMGQFKKHILEINDKFPRNAKLVPKHLNFPGLQELGFKASNIKVHNFDLSVLENYRLNREIPALSGTSHLGPHLRFGTVSIRQITKSLKDEDDVFLGELIWREFFMQILSHFPRIVNQNFKIKYNDIPWRNNPEEFNRWCEGETGYPMVDAGMKQLNRTGYMHNRVRMVVASFLCKHLLIDWRWGEAYFAGKLLDFELSSNNGNWQWAAGTGCDAAPYFRVFNPEIQLKKFDPEKVYIRQWIPSYGSSNYPKPMVEHEFARERAIETYKIGLKHQPDV